MKKIKIGVVIPSFFPATVYGGPIFSSLHTCEALAAIDGVKVLVSTTTANKTETLDVQPNVWHRLARHFYVKYYSELIVGKVSLSLLVGLWKDIKRTNVLHVQSIFSVSTPIALVYAKLLGKPVLLSPRGQLADWSMSQGSRLKSFWLTLLILPFAKRIVWHATSQTERSDILSLVQDADVRVVTNGIETLTFMQTNNLSRNEYMSRFAKVSCHPSNILVSMGRIHKVKGFDILIKAFAVIEKQLNESCLLIAGKDDGELTTLMTLVKQMELDDCVFFVGELSGQDKVDFLANADLFVLPSHTENFGNVYIESLATGTPIIASENTPWEEVEEADCGRWVNNSVEETADAMTNMLRADKKRMRENARKFSEKFDWKNIAIEFKNVFEEMVEKV